MPREKKKAKRWRKVFSGNVVPAVGKGEGAAPSERSIKAEVNIEHKEINLANRIKFLSSI